MLHLLKGQYNCIQNVMPSSSTFTSSCCNEHSSNILIFFTFSSMFSSQALVDCIEGFGNNAYQDLVPKRTHVLSWSNGNFVLVQGSQDTHQCSSQWWYLFLKPQSTKTLTTKKSYRTPRSPSENHGKSYQSFRRIKGMKLFGSHL